MLTAEGCRTRRRRLLDLKLAGEPLLLADPLSLRYFANASADPMSIGSDYLGVLRIDPDGKATLIHDARAPKSVELAHVDERVPVKWYDGKSAGRGPRRLILADAVKQGGGRIHDLLNDPLSGAYWNAVDAMRRTKDSDEIELLKTCMRATEAGHAWARSNVKAGMTELEVFAGMLGACTVAAGHAVVIYGDFTVSTGSQKRGGPPTSHKLEGGETLILDYSVVIGGYRSDFTNTLVVGGKPTAGQRNLLELSQKAMTAGERELRAGAACQAVYDAVRGVFARENLEGSFPHHAGHGLGLSHPEAPFFVEHSSETLVAGDVVTLEPGLYVDGVGGVRIEHNYLVTDAGFERLSNHAIALG